MALDVGGRHATARAAYRWLRTRAAARTVLAGHVPRRRAGCLRLRRDASRAYVAVGLCAPLLAHRRRGVPAPSSWPTVREALDFVVRHQAGVRGGARGPYDPGSGPDEASRCTGARACTTGCAAPSAIAERCGLRPSPTGSSPPADLADACAAGPTCSPTRAALDGLVLPDARRRVRGPPPRAGCAARWDEFVVPGFGIRCVADRPWVTGAETCSSRWRLHADGDADAGAHVASPTCSTSADDDGLLLDRARLRRGRALAGRAHHVDGRARGGARRRRDRRVHPAGAIFAVQPICGGRRRSEPRPVALRNRRTTAPCGRSGTAPGRRRPGPGTRRGSPARRRRATCGAHAA
jgi:hypothetical protein